VGFVFFLIQAVIPFFLMIHLMRSNMSAGPSRSAWPHVWNAVYWN